MTSQEIKSWIKNIIKVHRVLLADSHPGINVDNVWNCYMENSDDVYVNICDAFLAIGYDIEK